jgi:subtilisin family serine protease
VKRHILCLLLCTAFGAVHAAPSIDPLLQSAVNAQPMDQHAVVITYHDKPDSSDLLALSLAGITGGYVLNELPMVLTKVNRSQFDTLKGSARIASLYANRIYEPMTNASREFIGQGALQRDTQVTAANGGLPVSGKGIGVAIIDTGLDATHFDHQLGNNVVQNVYFPMGDIDPVLCLAHDIVLGGCLTLPAGFVPPIGLEGQPFTDVEGGHGTFVAGVVGGTGETSGSFYGGVAPGAELIGLMAGNDVGLTTFTIVTAYDWILVNQFQYNIRVANNSFGANLGDPSNYDPFDPINVGTRKMHDRFIAVVFAAGNSGSVPGAINRLAVAPWVISVAAGLKEGLGTPAGFSSRGWDNGSGVDSAGHPADPFQAPNLRPDITAPGADIKATRSKGPGLTNTLGTLLLSDRDIAPAFLPFYTTSSGTSFAAPHVAGVAALMLETNPMLSPQDIMEILRATAMPMPFEERVVGAGYVDAHNAVRMAMGLALIDPPADLMPGPGAPHIIDARNDQLGTRAQDILSGRFNYDQSTNRLIYTLEVADLEERLPNNRWTQASVFGNTQVFVSTNVTETGAITHTHGTIALDPDTGINTQTNLGPADAGRIEGNFITVELGLNRINDAVGFDVLGTTSTDTQANAWILIGTSFTGGLLLNADSASGTDFTVGPDGNGNGNGNGEDPPLDPDACAGPGIKESFAGAALPGIDSDSVSYTQTCASMSAQLTYNPGNAGLSISLHDERGNLVATANKGSGRRIEVSGLESGKYEIRIHGDPAQATDYVLQVRQKD